MYFVGGFFVVARLLPGLGGLRYYLPVQPWLISAEVGHDIPDHTDPVNWLTIRFIRHSLTDSNQIWISNIWRCFNNSTHYLKVGVFSILLILILHGYTICQYFTGKFFKVFKWKWMHLIKPCHIAKWCRLNYWDFVIRKDSIFIGEEAVHLIASILFLRNIGVV